jgi:cold shock CspA family protein/ribosome-associated translation inhibitor RaiA
MQRPLEIEFHNLSRSESLEALIREKFAKLEKRFPRLTGARVSVEALHRQHRTGNTYDCHIVLSVPGRGDLAVSRAPHRAADLRICVREAFEAAERMLRDRKEQLREEATGPRATALTGQVALIELEADHGFILTNTGTRLYFHADSVTNAQFADLTPGQVVHYVEEQGDNGPVATKVRVA